MTFADPNDQVDLAPAAPATAQENTAEPQPATSSQPVAEATGDNSEADDSAAGPRRRILIGSQRDPAAYRARQRRDWTPIEETPRKQKRPGGESSKHSPKGSETSTERVSQAPQVSQAPPGSESDRNTLGTEADRESGEHGAERNQQAGPIAVPEPISDIAAIAEVLLPTVTPPPVPLPATPPPRAASTSGTIPPPNLRERLSPDLEEELHRALGEGSFDELMSADASRAEEVAFEAGSLHGGRVIAVRREDVFVELGSHDQGIVPLRQFDVPPQPGAIVQVVVQRLNPEDGLYELSVPNVAVQVDDWSDLIEGRLIEVRVTGHNTGGLECEVNHIRGFIPVSQIALYRVEDLAQFVDQRLTCVITEADPDRRNLVLSRRAVLEREREEARQQLLASLQPGQIREGVVRKLMDFGAFVDLGGADGLLHISQLAWGRVKHSSDVLHEGQKIQVRIEKVDPETGKISLAYRDLLESPWTDAARKYPQNSTVRGTVTKLMDFGAFVELEPGVEGLVHISELSHKRVWRASDVVHEGDQVEVLVLSVDAEAQRIGLSMKALATPVEPAKKEEDESSGAVEAGKTSRKSRKPEGPLLGGLGRPTGERFGLKW